MNKIVLQTVLAAKRDHQLNQEGQASSNQQKQGHETLVQYITKRKLHPIKLVYEHSTANEAIHEEECYKKVQGKKKIFEARRTKTNRLIIQEASRLIGLASETKSQERDSQSQECKKSKQRGMCLDQFISSPKQRLQSLKHHLRTVREENQNYLKNKMNVIKQKIKIKREKGSIEDIIRQKKGQKINERSKQKQHKTLKIQKYDERQEYALIKKGIQIQKCHVLNFHVNHTGFSTIEQENRARENSQSTLKQQKFSPNSILQSKSNSKVKKESKMPNTLLEKQLNLQQSQKKLFVNRLSNFKNFISILKPERDLEKNSVLTQPFQGDNFLKIKSFNQTSSPEKSHYPYSKSVDVTLFKKNQNRLSQQISANNFIKGSVIYRLLKQRNNSKKKDARIAEAQKLRKQAENEKDEYSCYIQEQKEILLNSELDEKHAKKRKKVVLSNKNINKYLFQQSTNIKEDELQQKPDSKEQPVRSQLYYEQQQSKSSKIK